MSDKLLYKVALNKAMALCSRREYCASEINEKLSSWGVEGTDAERITAELFKENFLNEERFAVAFAKDKFKYNKWGKLKISAHLKHKKISSGTLKSALDSIENTDYLNTLNHLITTHRKSVKAKNQYDLKAKLLRYGLSKGFEAHLLYDILNDQSGASEEE